MAWALACIFVDLKIVIDRFCFSYHNLANCLPLGFLSFHFGHVLHDPSQH